MENAVHTLWLASLYVIFICYSKLQAQNNLGGEKHFTAINTKNSYVGDFIL